jgi:hypothetical protein
VRAGFIIVLFAAAVARAGTVSVQLPQGTKCDFAQLRAALRVPPSSVFDTPQPDAVSLALTRDADAWSLTLNAPGQAALERKGFAQGDDCVAVFEAASLIVDRYLSSIDWKATPVEVSPLPPPEPPARTQLLLEVAGGAGLLNGISPTGELGLGLVRGPLLAEVEGAYLNYSQVGSTVIITQLTWAVFATVGWWWRGLRIEALGGAELLGASAIGTMHPNPVAGGGTSYGALPFGGLRLGYSLALTDRLRLGIRIAARAHSNFTFNAGQPIAEHITSHLADGELTLALSSLFF